MLRIVELVNIQREINFLFFYFVPLSILSIYLQLLELSQNSWHGGRRAVTQFCDNRRNVLVSCGIKQQAECLGRVLLRVNLIIRERVNRHALRKVDALAERDDTQAQVARNHGNITRAAASIHGTVAEHGLSGNKHTGSLE